MDELIQNLNSDIKKKLENSIQKIKGIIITIENTITNVQYLQVKLMLRKVRREKTNDLI